MKGDLSRFEPIPGDLSIFEPTSADNLTGVLYQQGRGLLDQDGNAATSIQRHLRELLGRDTIGPDLVAVPAQESDSFQVLEAASDSKEVTLTFKPGRGWVDGLPLRISGKTDLKLKAEYLGPPMQSPPQSASTIAKDKRDALILEVWEESLSAFQKPDLLLEPALGGPDTTARVQLQYALKLLRLGKGDACGSLAATLLDDLKKKGKLTVTPAPTQAVKGDCPVQLVGGYTGFEHYLFRIEIATPDSKVKARFKWSRFNGGLVGRGTYDQKTYKVTITANDQAINTCGLTTFYFEALAYDKAWSRWRAALTADATLTVDGELKLKNPNNLGGVANGEELFFRLWDGIALVEDYTNKAVDLVDGIRIQLDSATAGNANYLPGDYWTFPVRAAGAEFDTPPWPSKASPEGMRRHRAPLAILSWGKGKFVNFEAKRIQDCRRVFRPLTRLESCCSYTVGDGEVSHGDFDSIQKAAKALPEKGGEICVLPGRYEENLVIDGSNVHIRGCGERSRLVSPPPPAGKTAAAPAIRVQGSGVTLESLAIWADDSGIGVQVEDPDGTELAGLRLKGLAIQAAAQSAVKVQKARDIAIRECRITMKDQASNWPGIFVVADDVLIERSSVRVIGTKKAGESTLEFSGRGGIQLGGTCDRVRVIDNLIQGGAGNGITLGSLKQVVSGTDTAGGDVPWVIIEIVDPCQPCGLGTLYIPPPSSGSVGYRSAGALSEIRIERNRIFDMGLNGIGVAGFFETEKQPDLISVDGLDIIGNRIRDCLWRKLEDMPVKMRWLMGYGGVSLADVETLTLRDNLIEDNGPDAADPVCGVFVLQAEGADIDRNRIRNNGAHPEPEKSRGSPKLGSRAGIWITKALAPTAQLNDKASGPMVQQGIPAVRIHDNQVSQPVGPALALNAAGPVSVQGNNLTSRGIVPRLFTVGFVASTVVIINLGMTPMVNNAGSVKFQMPANTYSSMPMDRSAAIRGNNIEIEQSVGGQITATKDGAGATWVRGDVHFCNNIVESDAVQPEGNFSLSSVLLTSLDDIACNDNQFTCLYIPGQDFALANVAAVGMSVRMNDNRFKEVITGQGLAVLFSGLSIGLLMNHTTDNQANHCLFAHAYRIDPCREKSTFMVFERNLVLPDLVDCNFCVPFSKLLKGVLGGPWKFG